jgi:lipopolysaccharide transport system ATP-binding protein
MIPAIRVERLSKSYAHSGGPRPRYRTVRDSLDRALSGLWRRSHLSPAEPAPSLRWVLRDVSFDVQPGEVVGIIGRNGAGKSTLLKILSRITEPTSGRAELRGRVGSLLEVGTGFHAELTGRENVFLNGAILGMSRREILRQFDEIVAFAEIASHLDLPVKCYSTGMRMRLAFAVASHFTPEILLLDEVLAVGDASFQRKCIRKMQEVGAAGRTVLLVSHNLTVVTALCRRALWLHETDVVQDGPAPQVVADYLRTSLGAAACKQWPEAAAPGNEIVRMQALRVAAAEGPAAAIVDIRRPIVLEMEYEVLRAGQVLAPTFHLYNEEGVCACVLIDQDPAWRRRPRPTGHFRSQVHIPGNLLAEGTLAVHAGILTPQPFRTHCFEREVLAFQVVDSGAADSARADYDGHVAGVFRPLLPWATSYAG